MVRVSAWEPIRGLRWKGRNLSRLACAFHRRCHRGCHRRLSLYPAEEMTVGRFAGASGGAQWSHQVRREKEGEGSGLHPGKETLREELFETLPWRQTTRARGILARTVCRREGGL